MGLVLLVSPLNAAEVCCSIGDVLTLPDRLEADDDGRYPVGVDIEAVVTHFDPDWLILFVQDESGAVSVKVDGNRQTSDLLPPGTVIRIQGRAARGSTKPTVEAASLEVLDEPLKSLTPTPIDFDDMVIGFRDSEWVSGRATVLNTIRLPTRLLITAEASGRIFNATIPGPTRFDKELLACTKVELTGCIGTEAIEGASIPPRLCIPDARFVEVIHQAPLESEPIHMTELFEIDHDTLVTFPGHVEYADERRCFVSAHGISASVSLFPGRLFNRSPLKRGDRVKVTGYVDHGNDQRSESLSFIRGIHAEVVGHGQPSRRAASDSTQATIQSRLTGRPVFFEGRIESFSGQNGRILLVSDGQTALNAVLPIGSDTTSLKNADRVAVEGIYQRSDSPAAADMILVDTIDDVHVIKRKRFQINLRVASGMAVVTLIGLVCVVRFRREAQHRQDELAASEMQYRTIFEQSLDILIVTDRDGVVRQANPMALQFLELNSSDEILQKPISNFVDVQVTDPGVDCPRAMVLDRNEPMRFVEIRRRVLDDTIHWHMRDLTDEDLMKKRLRRSAAIEAMGLMAGSIAHDFKNVLGAVSMTSEFISQQTKNQPELFQALDSVKSAVIHGETLASRLLRLKSDPECIVLGPTNIVDVARHVHQSFRSSYNGIEYDIDVPKSPVVVTGDSELIMRVLFNLFSNSTQAISGKGKVSICVNPKGSRQLEGRPSVEVRVTDTGTGIPLEIQSRIFEPFFTSKEKDGGTGLGLYSVKESMESLGGMIELESTPGVGTTFTLHFVGSSPAEKIDSPLAHLRVLVVDDDPELEQATSLVFSLAGAQVTSTIVPTEAIELLRSKQFDALVTDLVMKPNSGLELAAIAKEFQDDCRVVLVSGYADVLSQKSSLTTDVVDEFLTKPISARHIVNLVSSSTRSSLAGPKIRRRRPIASEQQPH